MKPLNIVVEIVGGPTRVGLRHVDLNTFGGISLRVCCIFVDCTSACSTGWVAGVT